MKNVSIVNLENLDYRDINYKDLDFIRSYNDSLEYAMLQLEEEEYEYEQELKRYKQRILKERILTFGGFALGVVAIAGLGMATGVIPNLFATKTVSTMAVISEEALKIQKDTALEWFYQYTSKLKIPTDLFCGDINYDSIFSFWKYVYSLPISALEQIEVNKLLESLTFLAQKYAR